MTASQLRRNIYNLLDQVLEIERKGRKLRIVAEEPPRKLDNLKRREDYIVGDPEDLVHMDWSEEWRPSPATPSIA